MRDRVRWARALSALVVVVAAVVPLTAFAQAGPAGIVTGLQGRVTVAREAVAAPRLLGYRDDVFFRDTITTADQAIARLLLGGKAVVTVRERSVLTITEIPGRSTIELESGKIGLAVARERMRPGESIEVRTGNAIAGVRGTALVIETSLDAAAIRTTNFFGFTGSTDLAFADPTGVFSRRLPLVADTFATGIGTGVPRSGLMSPQQRAAALAGLQLQPRQVAGGQEAARDSAVGTTLATFGAGAPQLASAQPPPSPPPPPELPIVLPYGDRLPDLAPPPPSPPASTARVKPSGTGVAIFGDFGAERDVLAARLAALQPSRMIFNAAALPADLAAFGTVWQVSAFAALTPAEQTRLATFLGTGGGVFLTGERPCCEALNDSLTALLRSVVVDGEGITVGRRGDFFDPLRDYLFNPDAAGGVTTTPNGLVTWGPSAPGGIAGVAGDNILVTESIGGVPVGAVWDHDDLEGDRGRIALFMDVNWLTSSTSLTPCDQTCRDRIIENLLAFLDDPPAPLTLTGPLFRSAGELLPTPGPLFDIAGYTIVGTGTDPLFWFLGSTVPTDGDFLRIATSDIRTRGSFVRLEEGARVIQHGRHPVVSVLGGTLSVGEGEGGGHLVEVLGRPGALHADPDPDPVTGNPTGLTFGSDRPLEPGPGAPVLAADGGAVVTVRGSAYKVDTALLEATAPVLALAGHSTVTTSRHAVDLAGRAKVSVPADAVAMISVDASRLTVRSGHLVNLAGGSRLNVAGDLLRVGHGGRVDVVDGLLLSVTGGSVASLGTLVRFTGTGNALHVSNRVAPTALVGGVPVFGPAGAVTVTTGAAIAGLGTAGSITINGVPLTSSTPLSSLTGSLVGVHGAGTVRIGP
jgi:hypothetical protein